MKVLATFNVAAGLCGDLAAAGFRSLGDVLISDALANGFQRRVVRREQGNQFLERDLQLNFPQARELGNLEKLRDGLLPLVDLCLLYTSPSPRDATLSRMPSSA